jgi:hypothetical protein
MVPGTEYLRHITESLLAGPGLSRQFLFPFPYLFLSFPFLSFPFPSFPFLSFLSFSLSAKVRKQQQGSPRPLSPPCQVSCANSCPKSRFYGTKRKRKQKQRKEGKFKIDVCLSSFDTYYLHDPHFELRISPTNVALNSLVWQFGKFRYP